MQGLRSTNATEKISATTVLIVVHRADCIHGSREEKIAIIIAVEL